MARLTRTNISFLAVLAAVISVTFAFQNCSPGFVPEPNVTQAPGTPELTESIVSQLKLQGVDWNNLTDDQIVAKVIDQLQAAVDILSGDPQMQSVANRLSSYISRVRMDAALAKAIVDRIRQARVTVTTATPSPTPTASPPGNTQATPTPSPTPVATATPSPSPTPVATATPSANTQSSWPDIIRAPLILPTPVTFLVTSELFRGFSQADMGTIGYLNGRRIIYSTYGHCYPSAKQLSTATVTITSGTIRCGYNSLWSMDQCQIVEKAAVGVLCSVNP